MKFWFSLNRAAGADEDRILMLRDFLRENFIYLVSGLALAALVAGGWQWWAWYGKKAGREASTAYVEHLFIKRELDQSLDAGMTYEELDAGKVRDAGHFISRFRTDYRKTAYAALAHLNQASWLIKAERLDKAAEILEWAVDNPVQPAVQSLSAVRLARVLIETGKSEQAIELLNSLIPSKPMGVLFEEIRGDAYYSLKRYTEAAFAYREAYELSVKKPLFLHLKLIEATRHIPEGGL